MKPHYNPSNITRVGVESETTFTIKSTARSFEILSSALYTDPLAAIIRELSCNAYDSHVAAGKKDIPFQIHLPNSLEPFLSIKDYGIGLSDEDVLHLYTTYFDSTKTASNDYIGALGLGSKSPFSYTKSYEVISRFNGYFRSYHMFINEEGIPDVAKMLTKTTDEENGLEIKIGIEPSDFNLVNDKTSSTLKHFNVLPIIVGAAQFSFKKVITPKMKMDNWSLHHSYPNENRMIVVQGNVQYKVNLSQFNDELTTPEQSLFNYVSMIGYFNIGDIEVAANREEIRYDSLSKQKIITLIRSCIKHIVKTVENMCNESITVWDLYIKLQKFSESSVNSINVLNDIIRDTNTNTNINNTIFQGYVSSGGRVDYPRTLQHYSLHNYSSTSSVSTKRYSRISTPHIIKPNDTILVVLNDIPTGGVARLADFLQKSSSVYTLIVIKPAKKLPLSKHFLSTNPDFKEKTKEEEYTNIINELGNPKVHLLSELCPPVKPKQKQKRELKQFTFGGTKWKGTNYVVRWQDDVRDIEDGGLYFVLKYGTDIFSDYNGTPLLIWWHASSVKQNLHHLAQLINLNIGQDKYTYDDIFGISVATFNKIKKDSNWSDAFVLAKPGLKKVQQQINTRKRMHATEGIFNIIEALQYEHVRDAIQHDLPTSSSFRKIIFPVIKKINKLGENQEFYNFCSELQNKLSVSNKKKIVDNTPYFNDSDFDKYPLINIIKQLPTDHSKLKSVIEYIKLIDEKNK
jgi:hypothetical protein